MSRQQDWFMNQKWGVFTHYLSGEQNDSGSVLSMGKGGGDWNQCVNELDVKALARELHEAGAHYLVLTLMQGHQYMCAPNAAFDRITGYRPGEACSERDLPMEMYEALEPYGISLFLYYTGDGPYKDEKQAGPRMGFLEPRENVSDEFVANWAEVLKEYAVRYGDKVKGWWIDGCYTYFGYTDEKLRPYADAIRAGNPEALIAFNGGVKKRVVAYSALDDYTCGEMNSFVDLPDERFIDGAQWHTLAPLGIAPDGSEWGAWAKPGCKHSAEHMADYIKEVNRRGGVVSIDAALYRDGHIDPEQLELLKTLKEI